MASESAATDVAAHANHVPNARHFTRYVAGVTLTSRVLDGLA